MNKKEIGTVGEKFAARYLQDQGYKIIDRNYHSRFGEIDIITTKEKYIVFIEVKTRSERAMVSGFEAVGIKKQIRIIKTALLYLGKNNIDLQPRFDVIEIITSEVKNVKKLKHLENAFGGDYNESF